MRKKDYIAIAKILRVAREAQFNKQDTISFITSELSYLLSVNNKDFNHQKFVDAIHKED